MANSVFIFPGDVNYSGTVTGNRFLAGDGSVSAPSYSFTSQPTYGMFFHSGIGLGFSAGNDEGLALLNGSGPVIAGSRTLGFASDSSFGSRDLFILRDASNTLAQVNGVNSQIYRLYGYKSGSRLTRGSLHSITEAVTLSGATSATSGTFIPVGCFVIGVATSTTTVITGASGYQVGDGTTAARWGDITGTAVGTNSNNTNSTANPTGYFAAAQAVTLTAKTSNFTGGVVQVTVFYLTTGSA